MKERENQVLAFLSHRQIQTNHSKIIAKKKRAWRREAEGRLAQLAAGQADQLKSGIIRTLASTVTIGRKDGGGGLKARAVGHFFGIVCYFR